MTISTTIALDELLAKKSRTVQRDPAEAPTHDLRETLFELEAKGELIVQRVPEPFFEVKTKFGRVKKIPLEHTWHHKSCGQCGHIPGYTGSIFWLHRQFGLDHVDPTDQTSCTGWNYYASGTSNAVAQLAVMSRNFAAAYETGYYPLIHCGKTVKDALFVMTDKGLGAVSVVDDEGKFVGLITDGIIRRALAKDYKFLDEAVEKIMFTEPLTIAPQQMAAAALSVMEKHKPRPVTVLPVIDEKGVPVGIVHLTDLLRQGVV